MSVAEFVTVGDEWLPATTFGEPEGSVLHGALSFPLASFLSADAALYMADAADRLISWATAMKLRAIARVEEAIGEESFSRNDNQPTRFGGDEFHALAVSEVATAGGVSEAAAARLLHDAADGEADQWEVLEALEAGELSPAHLRVILDQARSVPAECAERFSRAALQQVRTRRGRRRTPSELRACLRRLREQLHPESIETRKRTALRERGVWFAPEQDGMCTLSAFLPAEAGLAIFNGLDHDARTARAVITDQPSQTETEREPDLRTLSELRADALIQRLLGKPAGGLTGVGGVNPFRAEVVVTIPVEVALGKSDDAVDGDANRKTAELDGYGPIDAVTARRLAVLAPTWHRLFTDAQTGEALGVGRAAYRPPKALRRFLVYRDGTCRFPGCTRSASSCEPDHTIEWRDGGTTDAGNLALLCRRHHALKSIGAWTYAHSTLANEAESGFLAWRSPLGRSYVTNPAENTRPSYPIAPIEGEISPPTLGMPPPAGASPPPKGANPPPF